MTDNNTQIKPDWRTATIPDNAVLFAIGDIHAYTPVLETMLNSIVNKIEKLPAGVKSKIIFTGDYIDRGDSAPETINALNEFKKQMDAKADVEEKSFP